MAAADRPKTFAMSNNSIFIALLIPLVPALAFECLSRPGPIRERMPDARDSRMAVFIGQVRSLSPSDSIAHIHISETFAGPPLGTEIELKSMSAEAFRFAEGGTYLIEAYRANPENPWTTSTCQHTRPIKEASDDLIALRAWKRGQEVPCDLVGLLWGRDNSERRSGIGIRLVGEAKTFQTVTDREGRFRFKNVPAGNYEITATKSGWKTHSVNITKSLCPNGDLFPR